MPKTAKPSRKTDPLTAARADVVKLACAHARAEMATDKAANVLCKAIDRLIRLQDHAAAKAPKPQLVA